MSVGVGERVRAGVAWQRVSLAPGWVVVSLASFVGAWWLLSLALGNVVLAPSPPVVAAHLKELAGSGELAGHVATSIRHLVLGYFIGATLGIVLGVLMAATPLMDDLFAVSAEFLRPIPAIAWIPLGLFIFGVGEQLPVFLIAYSTFFPFLLNTFVGVRQIPRVLLHAARTLGATRGMLWRDVVLPGALPSILVGARIASGLAWMTIVAAELVGGTSGLGFMMMQFANYTVSSGIIAGMIVIAVAGFATDRFVRWLHGRLCPWVGA